MTTATFDDYLALSPAGRLLLATRAALAARGVEPDRVFLRLRDDQESGVRLVSVTALSAGAVIPAPLELLADSSRLAGCRCTCDCVPCGDCEHSVCEKEDQCPYVSDDCDGDTDESEHEDERNGDSVAAAVKTQRQRAEPHILEHDGERWKYTDMRLFRAPVRSTCNPWHDHGPSLTADYASELAAFLAGKLAASAARDKDPEPEGSERGL